MEFRVLTLKEVVKISEFVYNEKSKESIAPTCIPFLDDFLHTNTLEQTLLNRAKLQRISDSRVVSRGRFSLRHLKTGKRYYYFPQDFKTDSKKLTIEQRFWYRVFRFRRMRLKIVFLLRTRGAIFL